MSLDRDVYDLLREIGELSEEDEAVEDAELPEGPVAEAVVAAGPPRTAVPSAPSETQAPTSISRIEAAGQEPI